MYPKTKINYFPHEYTPAGNVIDPKARIHLVMCTTDYCTYIYIATE